MQKMYLLIMLLGGAMVLRALYRLVWMVYLCWRYECIERIAKELKACDVVMVVYDTFAFLIWTWLLGVYVCHYFGVNIDMLTLNTIAIGVLGLVFIVFFTLKRVMRMKYNLRLFYHEMVEYRSTLEVMTEDNDYEVNFIRVYEEVERDTKKIVAWMTGALALYLFVI